MEKLTLNNLLTFLLLGISFLSCNIIFAQSESTLKSTFKNHFLIGAAIKPSQFLEEDELDASIVKEHFNSITAENVLKWENVHPEVNKYNFEPSDRFVEFGVKEKMFIVGHTLVWHAQTPDWVFSEEKESSGTVENENLVDRETLLNRMREHIITVVGRYKGRIGGWDVVNEALNEDGTLRESKWLKIIGEDYINKAFEFAREADPDAELYYNDYSLENKSKRDGAVKLIKKLLSEGVKIDGVGLQGHYKMDWPTTQQVDSTIKVFGDLGLKVMITELDLDVLPYEDLNHTAEVSLTVEMKENLNPYRDGLPDSAQQSLADRYADLFKVFISNSDKINRITFWGVTDKDSWLNNWPVSGRSNYPLLFDRDGKTKQAYESVIKEAGKK